jgi:parvulin-like peptidyl-prolyl isomerase
MIAIAIAVYATVQSEDPPILEVNDVSVSQSEYTSILKSQRLYAQSYGGSFNPGVAPYELMQNLAQNELIRQAAPREGLSVTEQEIEAEILRRLVPGAEGQPIEGQVRRDYEAAVSNYLSTTQLSFDTYKSLVEIDLMRNQLRERLGRDIQLVQPHAEVHMIQIADIAVTDQVESALNASDADFAKIALQFSVDQESRANGGRLGWIPRTAHLRYDDFLFGLDVGELSQPIQAEDGEYYVVRLTRRIDVETAELHAIKVPDVRTARDVRDQLEAARFEDLSAEISTDPDLRAARGSLGIVTAGDLDGLFDEIIRGLAIGEVSPPVTEGTGSQYIMVSERTSAREVDADNLDTLKTRALETWLSREWDANRIEYCPGGSDNCFGSIKVDKVLSDIDDISLTRAQELLTATAVAQRQASSQNQFGLP